MDLQRYYTFLERRNIFYIAEDNFRGQEDIANRLLQIKKIQEMIGLTPEQFEQMDEQTFLLLTDIKIQNSLIVLFQYPFNFTSNDFAQMDCRSLRLLLSFNGQRVLSKLLATLERWRLQLTPSQLVAMHWETLECCANQRRSDLILELLNMQLISPDDLVLLKGRIAKFMTEQNRFTITRKLLNNDLDSNHLSDMPDQTFAQLTDRRHFQRSGEKISGAQHYQKLSYFVHKYGFTWDNFKIMEPATAALILNKSNRRELRILMDDYNYNANDFAQMSAVAAIGIFSAVKGHKSHMDCNRLDEIMTLGFSKDDIINFNQHKAEIFFENRHNYFAKLKSFFDNPFCFQAHHIVNMSSEVLAILVELQNFEMEALVTYVDRFEITPEIIVVLDHVTLTWMLSTERRSIIMGMLETGLITQHSLADLRGEAIKWLSDPERVDQILQLFQGDIVLSFADFSALGSVKAKLISEAKYTSRVVELLGNGILTAQDLIAMDSGVMELLINYQKKPQLGVLVRCGFSGGILAQLSYRQASLFTDANVVARVIFLVNDCGLNPQDLANFADAVLDWLTCLEISDDSLLQLFNLGLNQELIQGMSPLLAKALAQNQEVNGVSKPLSHLQLVRLLGFGFNITALLLGNADTVLHLIDDDKVAAVALILAKYQELSVDVNMLLVLPSQTAYAIFESEVSSNRLVELIDNQVLKLENLANINPQMLMILLDVDRSQQIDRLVNIARDQLVCANISTHPIQLIRHIKISLLDQLSFTAEAFDDNIRQAIHDAFVILRCSSGLPGRILENLEGTALMLPMARCLPKLMGQNKVKYYDFEGSETLDMRWISRTISMYRNLALVRVSRNYNRREILSEESQKWSHNEHFEASPLMQLAFHDSCPAPNLGDESQGSQSSNPMTYSQDTGIKRKMMSGGILIVANAKRRQLDSAKARCSDIDTGSSEVKDLAEAITPNRKRNQDRFYSK